MIQQNPDASRKPTCYAQSTMGGVNLEQIRAAIPPVPDFPQPGILFRDITPVLADAELFHQVINVLAEKTVSFGAEKVVGIDARGFLFGAAVAYKLGLGIVPIRKKGKLPYKTVGSTYQLEYGDAQVEMHVDAINPGERGVLTDAFRPTAGIWGAPV